MHNIDRTNFESGLGEYAGEYAGEYTGEYPGEYATEYAGEYPGEYAGENGYELEGEGEFEGNGEYTQEGPFSEAEEMELAAELLTVSNEEELEQFLGKLFKRAAGFLKSPIGQKLIGGLKGIARKALPVLGGAVGNFIVPGAGGIIGSKFASQAGSMFGLELEGLSYEDQEFEVAKQIVRLGAAAANHAVEAGETAPPTQVAQQALTTAAQQYAPGLLRNYPPQSANMRDHRHPRRHRHHRGQWVRRGNTIVLYLG
ncbi:MAG TPA: hypothetical protein VKA78_06610 [Pyrinomonadaceae bacterium]|nr:hypothetical protein [Pyrinomonadaceae bacterium]